MFWQEKVQLPSPPLLVELLSKLDLLSPALCIPSPLQSVEKVPLTLFANGLVMFQGPFRPFSDPLTQVS